MSGDDGPGLEDGYDMLPRTFVLSLLLTAACVEDQDTPPVDPATCPAAPFWQCGVRDGGWDLYCDGGVIYEKSYNGAMYCAPDSSEVVCESTDPTPRAIESCTSGTCNSDPTMRAKYLETYDEYSGFDGATLCAP